MFLRFEVALKDGEPDPRSRVLLEEALSGMDILSLRTSDLYWVSGLTPAKAERLIREAVLDPVVNVLISNPHENQDNEVSIEVGPRPGVTDPIAETLAEAAVLLGFVPDTEAIQIQTGRRHVLMLGNPSPEAPETLARLTRALMNPIVERSAVGRLEPTVATSVAPSPEISVVPLRELNDASLLALSQERRLALDVAEMRAIAEHFQTLWRDPTELELEMVAQTWSEHCAHKTFRAAITCEDIELDGAVKVREVCLLDLLKSATAAISHPRVVSAFIDNAGIFRFTDTLDLAIKVETHNHPSALEPFGGAHTGMGGVIRDILGVSARPVTNLDVLCFGLPDLEAPAGVHAPRRVRAGVIRGIEDYGNKMGIPTVTGTILHHPGYLRNPLVFCGSVGILPHGRHPTTPETGDLIVVLGGRTGRDGLRGATFSSLGMDAQTSHLSSGAVQIGHPIAEKQVLEVLIRARDERLYHALTDCGAGGLSSAVGELATTLGARVDLEKVPLKYQGLTSWEIWLSEAQERMVLAVPSDAMGRLLALAREHATEATVIGHFGHSVNARPTLEVRHHGLEVSRLETAFLRDGCPKRTLRARWEAPPLPFERPVEDLAEGLAKRLSSPDRLARVAALRRYDHFVGGGTIVPPLGGLDGDTLSDAAVILPFESRCDPTTFEILENQTAFAIAVALSPELGLLDPYCMAWASVDEALRRVVAVGADPDAVALLDNFSWGNPREPDRLGALARAVRGCHDAALHFGTPFISGKDSLNNEWTDASGVRHPIPPTLVITALGLVPNATRRSHAESNPKAGDLLYLLGPLNDHPTAFPDARARTRYRAIHAAFAQDLIASCRIVGRGGLAVAVTDLTHAHHLGAELSLDSVPGASALRPDRRIFCEGPGVLLVAVRPTQAEAFETLVSDRGASPCTRIGELVATRGLMLEGVAIELTPLTRIAKS
jgi:phosphoribosylformylglycinamidine synthase II